MRKDAIITLPSGRRARLVVNDPDRPWEVYPHGALFGLRRPRRGDSSQWELFKNSSALVVTYDKADLEFLIAALVAWTPPRQASSKAGERPLSGGTRATVLK